MSTAGADFEKYRDLMQFRSKIMTLAVADPLTYKDVGSKLFTFNNRMTSYMLKSLGQIFRVYSRKLNVSYQ